MTTTKQYDFNLYHEALLKAGTAAVIGVSDYDIYIDNNYFNMRLDEYTLSYVGVDNFKLIQYVRHKLLYLLSLSKKNELLLSRQVLAEVEAILYRIDNEEVKNILATSFLPAKSYFLYKIKDNTTAYQLLLQSIRADDFLEEDGFDILHFHKLQQVNNIARIQYADKDYDAWAVTMRNCLLYAFQQQAPFSVGSWQKDYRQADPQTRELLLLFVRQILNETIVFNHYLKNEYICKILGPLYNLPRSSIPDKHIAQWLYLVHNVNKVQEESVLHEVLEFIELPYSKYDLLKFSLLFNIYNMSKKEGVENAAIFKQCLDKLDISRAFKIKFKKMIN